MRTLKTTEYFVNRQCYWPDGDLFVEISKGGIDFANPGMLTSKYPGEGKIYYNPLEAAEIALQIQKLWQKDRPDEEINVGAGFTGGFTLPFDNMSQDELMAWAQKEYQHITKCDACQDVLPKKFFEDDDGFKFCSEYCFEQYQPVACE